MEIAYHKDFVRKFKKRFGNKPKFKQRYKERLQLFIKDQYDLSLRNHLLRGQKLGLRFFSVTGDIRVVFIIVKNVVYFLDIGTHNQVYK